jgi:hypothetical protein
VGGDGTAVSAWSISIGNGLGIRAGLVAVVWRLSDEGMGAALGGVAEAKVRGTGEATMEMVGGSKAGGLRDSVMGVTGGSFPGDKGGSNRARLARGRPGLGDAALGGQVGDDTGELEAAGKQTCARSLTASTSRKSLCLAEGIQPTPCTSEAECGPYHVALSFNAGAKYSASRVDSLVVCLR